MYNGFYALQKSFSGNVGGFLDALDHIEAELPINISQEPGEFEPAVVGVGSFLQGYCAHLALRLADTHGLDICSIHRQGELVHIFNTFQAPSGAVCYLDARGVTDDPFLFCEPFGVDISSLSGPFSRKSAERLMEESGWAFEEDRISDAMVSWILSSFPENFTLAFHEKEEKASLAGRIHAAKQKHAAQQPDPSVLGKPVSRE